MAKPRGNALKQIAGSRLRDAASVVARGAAKLADEQPPDVGVYTPTPSDQADALDASTQQLVQLQLQHLADQVDSPSLLTRALQNRPRRQLLSRKHVLPSVNDWSGLSAEGRAIYAMPENQGRLVRILDFVHEGERVVDIGSGQGSVGIRLIKSGRLERYCGIELSESAVESFHGMAAENNVAAADYEIKSGSAYDLASPTILAEQPTLITILEVLEHVPDPEGLVAAVAESMSDDTDLLVSVPLLGQIEHDWGHMSVFDGGRLRRLATDAGLHLHWVESVMGQWVFALMSRSPRQRDRIRSLPLSASPEDPPAPERYFFRPLSVTDSGVVGISALVENRDSLSLEVADNSVKVTNDNGWAGFTVYKPHMDVIRLHVQTEGNLTNGMAHFRHEGKTVEWWEFNDLELERLANGKTLVLRRGFDNQRAHNNTVPGQSVDRLELVVRSNGPVSIALHRAAYLPEIADPSQLRSKMFGPTTVSRR